MRRITQRQLFRWTGTVGPSHDPTHQETFKVCETRNRRKREVKLVQDYELSVYLNGRRVAYGAIEAHDTFKKLTGLTVRQVERAYWRVHPYFNDPMGHPSMYE